MKRGRKPEGTSCKLVKGNPGKRALAEHPKPSTERPECPQWLNEEAQAHWHRLADELARLGLLSILDGDVLALYCQSWAEYRWATEVLQREGRVFFTRSGYLVQHPLCSIQRAALKSLTTLGEKLGLTPEARARLSVSPPSEEVDALEAFLRS